VNAAGSVSSLNSKEAPIIVGVGGLTSDVGKTTLMCDLLRAFPGWEAIKTTRGHYRSCGKNPDTCCVSDLLGDEAVIRSGRAETYALGKDTGHYWESGASNVHWMIATDQQVEQGIRRAITRVNAPGVFIEGNSFSEYLEPQFFIMVARPQLQSMKRTARRALPRVSAFYFSGDADEPGQMIAENLSAGRQVPVFSHGQLPDLISLLKKLKTANQIQ
jgi:hypothetical protein